MPSQPENFFQFEKLLADLVRAGVDFAAVGGVAISLNGFVRATDDADIIVKVAPDNIGKMLACLRGWGEGWAREFQAEEFVPREGSLRLTEAFDLDIFTQMRGKSLDDFRPRLRYLETSGVRIPYIAPEDLLFLKQGSSRQKDQLDVAAMKEIIERERKAKR